jgi:hypothetical protein
VGDKLNQKEKEELKSSLSKSVIVLQLRDLLTKTGTPSDETVILDIQLDGESLVSFEIPKKSPQIVIAPLSTNFVEEFYDFLNRAEAFTGLLSALLKSDPSADGTTKIPFKFIFDIGTLAINTQDINTIAAAYVSNGPRQQVTVATHTCGQPPRPC